MKIKKFKNLWTMGIILVCAILVIFYVIKLFFPQLILDVAETERIIRIGTYIDTHKWAYYLYNFIIGMIFGYIYVSACCRKIRLGYKAFIIFAVSNVILILFLEFMPTYYTAVNYTCLVFMPFLVCLLNKDLTKETFISTSLCFTIDILAQVFSGVIRNIVIMTICVNSATMFILLIDMWIWRILLYLYFNNKNKGDIENGI